MGKFKPGDRVSVIVVSASWLNGKPDKSHSDKRKAVVIKVERDIIFIVWLSPFIGYTAVHANLVRKLKVKCSVCKSSDNKLKAMERVCQAAKGFQTFGVAKNGTHANILFSALEALDKLEKQEELIKE